MGKNHCIAILESCVSFYYYYYLEEKMPGLVAFISFIFIIYVVSKSKSYHKNSRELDEKRGSQAPSIIHLTS